MLPIHQGQNYDTTFSTAGHEFSISGDSAEDSSEDSMETQFEKLKSLHPALFQNGFMQAAASQHRFDPMPDVAMDHCLVCSANEHPYLGTSGVSTCHVFGGVGKTHQDQVFYALAHVSSLLDDPESILEHLQSRFHKLGCPKEKISFYVFGGCRSTMRGDDDDVSSVEFQCRTLELIPSYPTIKGVRFNLLTEEEYEAVESYAVVLGKEGMYYSKDNLFSSMEGLDEAGEPM